MEAEKARKASLRRRVAHTKRGILQLKAQIEEIETALEENVSAENLIIMLGSAKEKAKVRVVSDIGFCIVAAGWSPAHWERQVKAAERGGCLD